MLSSFSCGISFHNRSTGSPELIKTVGTRIQRPQVVFDVPPIPLKGI